MSKDTKKINSPKKILNLFEIPDSIIPNDKRAFVWSWDNKPPTQITTLKLNGTRLLSRGNTLLLTAKIGVGKSSVCEAICSNHLNNNCDSLGLSVQLPEHRNKIAFFDTEQSIDDMWDSGERIMRRAGIRPGTNISDKLLHINIKHLAFGERISYVNSIITENSDIGMVVIDGASDFMVDTNSIHEAVKFHDWLNTFHPAISIVVSVHTNQTDDKPRGHIGGEMMRKAKAVVLLKKLEGGNRVITTDFAHGKNRTGNDQLTAHYKYSEEENMFISTEGERVKAIDEEKSEKYREIVSGLYNGKTILSANYLITEIAKADTITEVAAKGVFYRWVTNKIVQKCDEGWRLV